MRGCACGTHNHWPLKESTEHNTAVRIIHTCIIIIEQVFSLHKYNTNVRQKNTPHIHTQTDTHTHTCTYGTRKHSHTHTHTHSHTHKVHNQNHQYVAAVTSCSTHPKKSAHEVDNMLQIYSTLATTCLPGYLNDLLLPQTAQKSLLLHTPVNREESSWGKTKCVAPTSNNTLIHCL